MYTVVRDLIVLKGECNPNIKYISRRWALQTVKIDTSLIKIRQEITKLLFKGFNMADIGTAILNIYDMSRFFFNFKILRYFYNHSICF